MSEPAVLRKFCLIIGLLLSTNGVFLHAQDVKAAYCFDDLVQRSCCELEQIYRQAKPGNIPVGFLEGKVVYCSQRMAHARSHMTSMLWHGKHFHCDGTLVNQWSGMKAIHARVGYGQSWLDGGQAIVLDYCGMSRVWNDVRDEMREVAPGLFVGAMYRGHCPCPELKLFFVLKTQCCCGK